MLLHSLPDGSSWRSQCHLRTVVSAPCARPHPRPEQGGQFREKGSGRTEGDDIQDQDLATPTEEARGLVTLVTW